MTSEMLVIHFGDKLSTKRQIFFDVVPKLYRSTFLIPDAPDHHRPDAGSQPDAGPLRAGTHRPVHAGTRQPLRNEQLRMVPRLQRHDGSFRRHPGIGTRRIIGEEERERGRRSPAHQDSAGPPIPVVRHGQCGRTRDRHGQDGKTRRRIHACVVTTGRRFKFMSESKKKKWLKTRPPL